MNNFFAELKRRKVLRMVLLYAVAAWLIVQVAEVLIDLASLPGWIGPTILWLLAIGFPIALIISWFYEITQAGINTEKNLDGAGKKLHLSGRRIDFIIISLLAAAVILFAYDKWGSDGAPDNSIAVLAFINMSDDASNEYFSDGISEELLNLLAKIPELRVTSRSSAFSYKGKDIDIPTVATELNVAHVLEGSVRKSGNQVRITVQLIEAQSDTHLWSQTYDRTLKDIFVTQNQIAADVVDQLKITLLGDIPTIQVTDPTAYTLVLQAIYLDRQRTPDTMETSIALYEQALAIDPEYARAWSGLSIAYSSQADLGLLPIEKGYRLAREAATQALAFDPTFAMAHANLAFIARHYDQDIVAAAFYTEKAVTFNPTSPAVNGSAAGLAAGLGRLDLAIALAKYASARAPVDPVGYSNLGLYYLYAGRYDEAIASFSTTLVLSPKYIGTQHFIGSALLMKGEPEAALAAMQEEALEAYRLVGLVMAYHALGQTTASDAALETLIEKYEQDAAYNIAYVLAYRGEADRAFEWLDKAVMYHDPGLPEIINLPLFANIQTDPRWMPFLENLGMSPTQLAAIEFNVTPPK